MNDEIKWYVDSIVHELEKRKEAKFTGNLSFQLNFKEGGIANMNIDMKKSVKKPR